MSKSVLWRVFLLIIIMMIMIRTILITIITTTIIKPIKPTTASLWSRYIMSLIIKTLSFQNYALGKLCFQILIRSTRQKILQTRSSCFIFLPNADCFWYVLWSIRSYCLWQPRKVKASFPQRYQLKRSGHSCHDQLHCEDLSHIWSVSFLPFEERYSQKYEPA